MQRLLMGLSLFLFACADTGSVDDKGPGGTTSTNTKAPDEDNDGYTVDQGDCDDNNQSVHPNASEVCNAIDDNCEGQIDEGVLSTFYKDADADGFGSAVDTMDACEAPVGFVTNNTDCDDTQNLAYPGNTEVCDSIDNDCDGDVDEGVSGTYYADSDGDGYGDPASFQLACELPDGYVEDNTDCDDGTARSFPGNTETCDEKDNDCDGIVDDGVTTTYYVDMDGDGFGNALLTQEACSTPAGYTLDATDCADSDVDVNPDATEVCNAKDDDCDGTIDENDAADASTWYLDADADGYGNGSVTTVACDAPAGYVSDATDCDDLQSAANPGSLEYCDGFDNDCDRTVDEDDAVAAPTWYLDADSDGYGNFSITDVACNQPTGYVSDSTDCNDRSELARPGADEICDSLDNDCDGATDEDSAIDAPTWYQDSDRDSYGNASVSSVSCEAPSGYVSTSTDCDDARAASYPGAIEYCNGYDDDCDGTTDEDTAYDAQTWYQDADADGYGDSAVTDQDCSQPTGFVADDTDCDDARAATNPGAAEYCNSIDDNCNGTVDEDSAVDASTWYIDADRDGYGTPYVTDVACTQPSGYVADGTDCNDGASAANPGATEICDSLDNNCDGLTDESTATDARTWYEDSDGDNYGNASVTQAACSQPTGYVSNDDDCLDTRALSYPNAPEYCNGYDDDCDGTVDEVDSLDASTWYADSDGDSYGNRSVTTEACTAPAGYVADSTDCLDTRAASYPGATEYCNSYDDDCDGTTDESSAVDASTWYIDADRDTYGNASVSQAACTQPSGYVADYTDCNDGASAAYPSATEICDSIDNDCDGSVDENSASGAGTWYQDFDGDNYGNASVSQASCTQPTGYVSNSSDCLDTRAASYPGATEYCNSYDDDCDGTVDEDASVDVRTWYRDADADTYGDAASTDIDCAQPTGYVSNDDDCLDSRAASNPAATEYCNGYDDDCDGTVDENAAADATTWYRDADSDGYGLSTSTSVSCSAPSGYVSNSSDCSDLDATAYPGATETCDGVDDDCDGTVDDNPTTGNTYYLDSDNDDFGDAGSTVVACSLPSGYADNYYDCNDSDVGEPKVADPVTGSTAGAGTYSSPFLYLQDALDTASECVVAYGGTYNENLDFPPTDIDVWGVEGADLTFIDGNGTLCSSSNPTACESTIKMDTNTGATPTFHGFSVMGGTGTYSSSTASTTCADSSASNAGRNTCTVTTYSYYGGGMYIYGDDPFIYDVEVYNNTLPDFEQAAIGSYTQYWLYSYGGGIAAVSSNAELEGVTMYGNYADQGGALYISSSSNVTFDQGIVSDNDAEDGAGVFVKASNATFTNAIVACNDAGTDGGGLFTETSGTTRFTNVSFYRNTSSTSGSARGTESWIGSSTTFYLLNSIAESSSAAGALYGTGTGYITYSNVYNASGSEYGGTLSAGAGTISSGSNFTSVTCDGNPNNDNFALRSSSSSINAGNTSAAYNDANGTRNDMGAYGGPGSVW